MLKCFIIIRYFATTNIWQLYLSFHWDIYIGELIFIPADEYLISGIWQMNYWIVWVSAKITLIQVEPIRI